jgi:hypothetical protein
MFESTKRAVEVLEKLGYRQASDSLMGHGGEIPPGQYYTWANDLEVCEDPDRPLPEGFLDSIKNLEP